MRICTLLLTLGLGLTACSQSNVVTVPTPSTSQPNAEVRKTVLGTVTLEFSLDGKASAQFVPSDPSLRSQALTVQPDTTINVDSPTAVSFYDDLVNGMRYINAEWKLTAIGQNFQNLTLVALSQPGTLAGTPIKNLLDATGAPVINPETIARSFIPTHSMMSSGSGSLMVNPNAADFQAMAPEDVDGLSGGNALGYGFVARGPSGRAITDGQTGRVALAYKFPLTGNRKNAPWSMTMTFLVVDDSVTTVTQSAEEQTVAGNTAVLQRATQIGATKVNRLPGSTLMAANTPTICKVKTATASGTSGDKFLFTPVSSFINTMPSIISRSTTSIDASFSTYCASVDLTSVTNSSFIVTGSQTGRYAGVITMSSGSPKFSLNAPANFKAGEEVTAQLTTAVKTNETPIPYTWRFRIGTELSQGTFNSAMNFRLPNYLFDITTGDFNNDGKLDIASVSRDNFVFLQLGNRDQNGIFTLDSAQSFALPGGADPVSITVGDFDGDGNLDIVTANQGNRWVPSAPVEPRSLTVLFGDGLGSMTSITSFSVTPSSLTGNLYPKKVATGDFNGDGRLDIVTANGNSANGISILMNGGNRSFISSTSYNVGAEPNSVITGDFNNDGKLDIITANSSSSTGTPIALLLGNGDGSFNPAIAIKGVSSPYRIQAGDFNGDGKLDLATVSSNGNRVSVFLNTSTTNISFGAVTNITVGTNTQNLTLGDLNGDGYLDIVTANQDSDNVSVLLGIGNGTFNPAVNYSIIGAGNNPSTGPASIATGDFNGDGKLDLAVPSNVPASSGGFNNDNMFILLQP